MRLLTSRCTWRGGIYSTRDFEFSPAAAQVISSVRQVRFQMFWLTIPCTINIVSWCVLFAFPMLGFRNDLIVPFELAFLVGNFSAIAGIIVAIIRMHVFYFTFFVFVLLLNGFGLLWANGVVVRAYM